MFKRILLGCAFLALTTSYADINSGGFYLGAGLGYGNSSLNEKIFGGYMFNRYWGLETDYTFWGSSNSTISTSGNTFSYTQFPQTWDGLVILRIPLGGLALSAHAKLGVSYLWLNGSNATSNTNTLISTTPSGSGLTSAEGVGIALNPWQHFEISLDWMNYGLIQPISINAMSNSSAGSWNGNNYIISIGYHF